MKTKAHRTLSAISQLFCILYIISAIITIILSYSYSIFHKTEVEVLKHCTITYYSFGIYLMAIDALFALFGGCVSSSGSKYLMGFFNKLVFFFVLVSISLAAYLTRFYKDVVSQELIHNQANLNIAKLIIASKLGNADSLRSTIIIKNQVDAVLHYYALNQALFLVSIVLVSLIFKKMRTMTLYSNSPVIPKIHEISKKGLNTQALSHRRVLEVVV